MTQHQSGVRYRPIIRVFVSSTFTDLKHERDALAQQVFVPLEQHCALRKFQFQAIDLRWGVSSEASFDHRTMQICFSELLRSQEISPKSNFLILLGNRYGWRPLPESISQSEFGQLHGAASGISRDAVEVLEHWYWKDENAEPAVYILQRRKTNSPDSRDYQKPEIWAAVEKVLWEIINRAYPPTQLRERFAFPAARDAPLTVNRAVPGFGNRAGDLARRAERGRRKATRARLFPGN